MTAGEVKTVITRKLARLCSHHGTLFSACVHQEALTICQTVMRREGGWEGEKKQTLNRMLEEPNEVLGSREKISGKLEPTCYGRLAPRAVFNSPIYFTGLGNRSGLVIGSSPAAAAWHTPIGGPTPGPALNSAWSLPGSQSFSLPLWDTFR